MLDSQKMAENFVLLKPRYIWLLLAKFIEYVLMAELIFWYIYIERGHLVLLVGESLSMSQDYLITFTMSLPVLTGPIYIE